MTIQKVSWIKYFVEFIEIYIELYTESCLKHMVKLALHRYQDSVHVHFVNEKSTINLLGIGDLFKELQTLFISLMKITISTLEMSISFMKI